jgi:hypothetical protein
MQITEYALIKNCFPTKKLRCKWDWTIYALEWSTVTKFMLHFCICNLFQSHMSQLAARYNQ